MSTADMLELLSGCWENIRPRLVRLTKPFDLTIPKWLGFFSRDIFERCEDYSCAKQHMMKDEMVSPVYFILADGHTKVNLWSISKLVLGVLLLELKVGFL